jgi:DNA-binding transcriptional regulator YiaG
VTNAYRVMRKAKKKSGPVQQEWAVRIVAMRERVGLTQRDFAALIGVSSKTLENWERKLWTPHILC